MILKEREMFPGNLIISFRFDMTENVFTGSNEIKCKHIKLQIRRDEAG